MKRFATTLDAAIAANPPGLVAGRVRKDEFERWIEKRTHGKDKRRHHH